MVTGKVSPPSTAGPALVVGLWGLSAALESPMVACTPITQLEGGGDGGMSHPLP